ncbi:MAG TPA: IS1595 family transposase [Terriglobales bacterium]|nr:IS1595 family transposase [Terriglobales bacterium]
MEPKTLLEAVRFFGDADNCHAYLVAARWPDGVACPRCGSAAVKYSAKHRRWQCGTHHERRQFTLKTGTIFEDSPLSLSKWLSAMWMLANCKNGVSSHEMARTLGITQKSAWFMLQRIREGMRTTAPVPMGSPDGGEVEADETFVGPVPSRMHKSRRAKLQAERSKFTNSDPNRPRYIAKTAVQGLLDRESKQVHASVVRNAQRESLQAAILEQVAPGSRLYTDEHPAYCAFDGRYIHEVVNHLQSYVRGRVHTNGIENFWSLLKRGLRGTYVAVEPFHLDRYLDEQVFRYNNRATKGNPLNDADRMALAASQVAGKRLTYKALTGKEGETAPI